MAKRLVAADASPLIGLASADAFHLLRDLFGIITVTTAVRDEVMAGGERPGARELAGALDGGWVDVKRTVAAAHLFPELGIGEASTLAFALKHRRNCLVLMDDPLGRARARTEGIRVTGVAGVLLAAKQAQLVENILPLLDRMVDRGFRLSADVIRAVLEQAGEE